MQGPAPGKQAVFPGPLRFFLLFCLYQGVAIDDRHVVGSILGEGEGTARNRDVAERGDFALPAGGAVGFGGRGVLPVVEFAPASRIEGEVENPGGIDYRAAGILHLGFLWFAAEHLEGPGVGMVVSHEDNIDFVPLEDGNVGGSPVDDIRIVDMVGFAVNRVMEAGNPPCCSGVFRHGVADEQVVGINAFGIAVQHQEQGVAISEPVVAIVAVRNAILR